MSWSGFTTRGVFKTHGEVCSISSNCLDSWFLISLLSLSVEFELEDELEEDNWERSICTLATLTSPRTSDDDEPEPLVEYDC